VLKPNSSVSGVLTFTLVTFSIPEGNLKFNPGWASRLYLPNRWITPTSFRSTVKKVEDPKYKAKRMRPTKKTPGN